GLKLTQGHKRFHVEQFNAAGLEQRGDVAGTEVGRKNKRTQRRHFTRVKSAPELGGLSFLFRAKNFSALDSSEEFLLERSEDLIASWRFLPMLLIIVQPKRGVNTYE